MAFAKFEENWFRIDGEIGENHAILVNLTASIVAAWLKNSHFKWLFLSIAYKWHLSYNISSKSVEIGEKHAIQVNLTAVILHYWL